MSKLQRMLQYGQARLQLGRLNHKTLTMKADPDGIFRELWSFAGGYFRPIQQDTEFVALARQVQALAPKVVLEIGTHWGGTLHMWTRIAAPDALIISIDLPGGEFGGGYSPLRTPLYQSFAQPTQRLHLLRADSHLDSTLNEVQELLGERKVEFAFIDGDHTYEGVRQDFETYGPLVSAGGLIAFHDIAKSYDRTEVERFWNEVKASYLHWEYCDHPERVYGIGVIQQP